RRRDGAGAQRREGDHVLSELRVRYADDGGLRHGGGREERRFDFGRGDGVAAPQNQLTLASDDGNEANRRDAGEIAGLEPAMLDHGARFLWSVEVAVHRVRAADPELAHLSGVKWLPVLIHHASLHPRNRPSDRVRKIPAIASEV